MDAAKRPPLQSPAPALRFEGVNPVFVVASTECFPDLDLAEAFGRLADLEYTRVEIGITSNSKQMTPAEVHADLENAITRCRDWRRLTLASFFVDIDGEGPEYYAQFTSCCKLAKATKVVSVNVRSAELGTPYNAEIERLRELVRIGIMEGVVVGVKTEGGRMTQDPATATGLCETVKGLHLALDPSHYTYGPSRNDNYDNCFKYTSHVYLRDTNKANFQVRVGQGEIEYNRIITQLAKFKYNRALCVHITEQPGVDHMAEMRKMRLLLESML